MKTIWKYFLIDTDEQYLEMPEGSKPLSVMKDPSGELAMWCEVDTSNSNGMMYVVIHGTGHPLFSDDPPYIGSAVVGRLVWHVFAEMRSRPDPNTIIAPESPPEKEVGEIWLRHID